MNRMGFNIQVPGAGLDLIGRYKPVASLLMDIGGEHVAEAKRLSPETEIVFRKEDGRKWRDKDPVEWAQAMWADVHECPPDWVVPDNEPLGHADISEFAAFDQWQRAFADWIHANTPMKVGMFGFPEGNFTKDGPIIPDHFPLSMEAADGVFIHEYWKPFLSSEGMVDWHCLRWPYWLEWFEEAGYPNMPIYVTEVGITMAVGGGPDVGYASEEAKAAGVTSETYLADLEEYHRRCCLEPRVKAVLPFIWRPWPGEWGTFVPTPEMTERMFTFDAPGPEPEPEPDPEPEEEMDFKVLDREGNELTGQAAEDLVAYHGLSVSPPNLQPGDRYFKLITLRDKTGDTAFIYRVRDEAGHLVVNPDEDLDRGLPHRAWWWLDVQDSNDIQTPYLTDRHLYADLGGLNVDGEGGSGMGAFHDPNTPGPYQAWVRHPTIKSDLLVGIGMIGSTNHDHMDGEWQEMVYEDGDDPEPEPTGELVKVSQYVEPDTPTSMFGIAYPLDVSIDTRGAGTEPVGEIDDTLQPEPWQHPTTGKDYALVEMCVDFGGDEGRTFTVEVYRMSDGRVLARDTLAVGPLGTAREHVISIFEHGEEPDDEPDPVPPEGVLAVLYDIADELEGGAVDLRAIADGLIQAQQLAADLHDIFSGE